MSGLIILVIIVAGLRVFVELVADERRRERRRSRYHEYLKSDAWKRKRWLVFKRDSRRCVYCGAPATQVHHTSYAPHNVGREPIDCMVSVCDACHRRQHGK
jgi:5-methylcytosine-specific restriction endonuclease McrA